MQKKIQEAMLVSENYLKETLPESFIFTYLKILFLEIFIGHIKSKNDLILP